MLWRRLLLVGTLTALFAAYPILALTFSGGPPAQRTGAPGEQTCNDFACHNSFALDSGPGQLSVDAPETYLPGETVAIQVRVAQAGIRLAGFELTVKDAAGQFAGTLELADAERTRFADVQRRYVSHSFNGAMLTGDGEGTWTVRWTAPAALTGDVTIYAAGNAADGNSVPTGDHIYTTQAVMQRGTGTAAEPAEAPAAFSVHRAYPNPAASISTVAYELRRPEAVTLTLYDALGRTVQVHDLGTQPAGRHERRLDLSVHGAGFYLYELRTPTTRESRPLLVLR